MKYTTYVSTLKNGMVYQVEDRTINPKINAWVVTCGTFSKEILFVAKDKIAAKEWLRGNI